MSGRCFVSSDVQGNAYVFGVDPGRTNWDLEFSIFRVPVRVHPFFWLVGLLLGAQANDPAEWIAWMIAFFVAILVHELGHAAAMRAYGFYPSITLYGLGGFTSCGGAFARPPSGLPHIVISAAGPAAGFAFAAILAMVIVLAGFEVMIRVGLPFGVRILVLEAIGSIAFSHLINDLFFITLFWGLVNLLPVYPLDGGQIAREVLVAIHPNEGTRWSLMLSFVTAALMAVVAFVQWQSLFGAILFGYFAYLSYVMLTFHGGSRW